MYLQISYCSIVAFVATLVSVGFACSPEGEAYLPKDIHGRVYYSHAVLIGRPMALYPEHNLGANVFTVTFQIDCIVKDTKGFIPEGTVLYNISQTGYIEGMCHSAEFRLHQKYAAYLRAQGLAFYTPWTSPLLVTSSNTLDDVMEVCDLKPTGQLCPSLKTPCISDVGDYSSDQQQESDHDHDHDHDHEHGDEHHDMHDHHTDEDVEFEHDHSDHHTGETDFTHDHDHSDHHSHDHEGEAHEHDNNEDYAYSHDHTDHHDHEEFDHDHDHSMHHEDEHNHDAHNVRGGQSSVRGDIVSLMLILLVSKFVKSLG